MGCFNAICTLSGLPIKSRDKARAVICVAGRKKPGESLIYPSDYVQPLCLPVTGIYNDYGTLENVVEDFNTDLIGKWWDEEIRRGTIKLDKDDHDCKSRADGSKGSKIEYILKMCEREYAQHNKHIMCNSLCLDGVWKPFYKSISRSLHQSYPYRAGIETLPKGGMIVKAKEQFDVWYKWYLQIVKACKKAENPNHARADFLLRWGARGLIFSEDSDYAKKYHPDLKIPKIDHDNMLLRFMSENREDINCYTFGDIYAEPFMKEIEETGQIAIWEQFRDALADFYMITLAMSWHEKHWMPFMYSRQEYELSHRRRFMKFCADYAEKKERAWDRECR